MKYTVIWSVEDDVFGGNYNLQYECDSYEEAQDFVEGLKHDDMTFNYEIFCPADY